MELEVDDIVLTGCRPRHATILQFIHGSATGHAPVVRYCATTKDEKCTRTFALASAEFVFDVDVMKLLVDFLSRSVDMSHLRQMVVFPRGTGAESVGGAPDEPPSLSLDSTACRETRIELRKISLSIVLAESVPSVGLCMDRVFANVQDEDVAIRVKLFTVSRGTSEFLRVQDTDHAAHAIQLVVGRRDQIKTVEIDFRYPFSCIGYDEIDTLFRVTRMFSSIFKVFTFPAVGPDRRRSAPLSTSTSPSAQYSSSPLQSSPDNRRLRQLSHWHINLQNVHVEVKDTGSVQRPLVIEFSAACRHNQYGDQKRSALETKGKLSVTQFQMYFQES
eukprot:COSAG01_NODE_12287_length_1765_cov_13.216086_1_plen_331_part_10